jgi:hypothetical protein
VHEGTQALDRMSGHSTSEAKTGNKLPVIDRATTEGTFRHGVPSAED